MNYFVEGIQGAGKSTMTEKLFREHPEYTVFREGDYCPVELAWCAYVDEDEYSRILGRYPALASEIAQNTVFGGLWRREYSRRCLRSMHRYNAA